MKSNNILLALLLLIIPVKLLASPNDIPEQLKPWVAWVQGENQERACPLVGGKRICTWHNISTYKISNSGASFELNIELLNKQKVMIPSRAQLYPHNLKVLGVDGENKNALAITQDDLLFLELEKGRYKITGDFTWLNAPAEIPLPQSAGLVNVELAPELSKFNIRRLNDYFILEEPTNDNQQSALALKVFRRIQDSNPLVVETALRIQVSGKSRSVNLGRVVPENSEIIDISSSLTPNILKDGSLSVNLLPGMHEIRIFSVLSQPVTKISFPKSNFKEWPSEELLCLQSDQGFRSIELRSDNKDDLMPISAVNTDIPNEWKNFAAYVLESGSEVSISELRRGEINRAPNSISLEKALWVDLNGDGFSVQDKFSGVVNQSSRLNSVGENILGRAEANDNYPKLISLDPQTKARGIELREQNLNFTAVSRIEKPQSIFVYEIDATGWDAEFNWLSSRLMLSPSWKFLHISDNARTNSSWLSSWSLLDVFTIILITIAAYKLFGTKLAIAAGISLVLNHGEFLAPKLLLIHLLTLEALRRIFKAQDLDKRSETANKIINILLWLTYALWAFATLAFAKLQFMQFLFPQLQAGTRYRTALQDLLALIEANWLIWPVLVVMLAVGLFWLKWVIKSTGFWGWVLKAVTGLILFSFASSILGMLFIRGSYQPASYQADKSYNQAMPSASAPLANRQLLKQRSSVNEDVAMYEERAEGGADAQEKKLDNYSSKLFVSGPALPAWNWRTHYFTLPAPIAANTKITIYLLPPWMTRIVCAISTLLSLFLLVSLLKKLSGFSFRGLLNSSTVSLVLITLPFCFPSKLSAQDFPSQEMLKQLEQRINKAECTVEPCATILSGKLGIEDEKFSLLLRVFSKGVSSIQIPGHIERLKPESITDLSGANVSLRANEQGFLLAKTSDGENSILIKGLVPKSQAFTIEFPQQVLFFEVSAPQRKISGLLDTGAVDGSLRFTELLTAEEKRVMDAQDSVEKSASLPSWFIAKRHINIGNDITSNIEILRLGQGYSAEQIRIPLLKDEKIVSANAIVENAELIVNFPPEVRTLNFSSSLPSLESLEIIANNKSRLSESLQITCEEIFTCTYKGLTPSASIAAGQFSPTWQPFPGETINVAIKPLVGIEGAHVTLDDVVHDIKWGANVIEGTINISLRSTQQEKFSINIPTGAKLKGVTVNGQSGTTTSKDNNVQVLLTPGAHKLALTYGYAWLPNLVESVPPVSLSVAANNIYTTVATQEANRWIIWTGGVGRGHYWGPCVVYWAKLIFIVAIVLSLQYVGLLQMRLFSAIFLALGLTSLPLVMLWVPLVWLGLLNLVQKKELFSYMSEKLGNILLVVAGIFSLFVFYRILEIGLVFNPPMLIVGNKSSAEMLRWYIDHTSTDLPQPFVVSLPMWAWRGFSLVWASWLVFAVIGWIGKTVRVVVGRN